MKNLNTISTFLLCGTVAGCAMMQPPPQRHATRTKVEDNSNVHLNGPNLYVRVNDIQGQSLGGPLAEKIKTDVAGALKGKGFVSVDRPSEAHLVLILVPGKKSHGAHVSGRSYAIPVYTPGTTSTFNTYNTSGKSTFGTINNPGSTQIYSGYEEGYDVTVEDQWILIHGFSQQYGKTSKKMFFGQIYRVDSNWEVFEDDDHLLAVLQKLIEATPLGDLDRAPSSVDSGKPSCRPMVGFVIDEGIAEKDKKYIMKAAVQKSPAEKAGLHGGDEILSIAGLDYGDFISDPDRLDRLYATKSLKVSYLRNGEQRAVTLIPQIICPDE